MASLFTREPDVERLDVFHRFDRMFDDWMKVLPLRRPMILGGEWGEDLIRVDEFRENGTLVVRAELPGIDPDNDVDLSVRDGMLVIAAERHEEEKVEEKGYLHRELRRGSFTRALALPDGVTAADIKATYKDGILEIRVPAPQPAPAPKIPITKS